MADEGELSDGHEIANGAEGEDDVKEEKNESQITLHNGHEDSDTDDKEKPQSSRLQKLKTMNFVSAPYRNAFEGSEGRPGTKSRSILQQERGGDDTDVNPPQQHVFWRSDDDDYHRDRRRKRYYDDDDRERRRDRDRDRQRESVASNPQQLATSVQQLMVKCFEAEGLTEDDIRSLIMDAVYLQNDIKATFNKRNILTREMENMVAKEKENIRTIHATLPLPLQSVLSVDGDTIAINTTNIGHPAMGPMPGMTVIPPVASSQAPLPFPPPVFANENVAPPVSVATSVNGVVPPSNETGSVLTENGAAPHIYVPPEDPEHPPSSQIAPSADDQDDDRWGGRDRRLGAGDRSRGTTFTEIPRASAGADVSRSSGADRARSPINIDFSKPPPFASTVSMTEYTEARTDVNVNLSVSSSGPNNSSSIGFGGSVSVSAKTTSSGPLNFNVPPPNMAPYDLDIDTASASPAHNPHPAPITSGLDLTKTITNLITNALRAPQGNVGALGSSPQMFTGLSGGNTPTFGTPIKNQRLEPTNLGTVRIGMPAFSNKPPYHPSPSGRKRREFGGGRDRDFSHSGTPNADSPRN